MEVSLPEDTMGWRSGEKETGNKSAGIERWEPHARTFDVIDLCLLLHPARCGVKGLS